MRTKFFPLLITFLSLQLHVFSQVNKAPFIIPTLREWTGGNGYFTFTKSVQLIIEPAFSASVKDYVNTFAADLKTFMPYLDVIIKEGIPKKGDIYFRQSPPDTSLNKEGYFLKIGEHIGIEAPTAIGAFWATRTLLQIIEQDSLKKGVPKGIAKDYPQFAVRGFVLDDGRKFFTIDFLRHYVKMMSYYKLNDFQIHLNDNGFKQFFNDDWNKTYSAFRLQNDTYPQLTAKDGSYSKKEFIDLQLLANKYGVKIVPEIDVPAHSLAFTHAIPGIGSKKYGMDHLDLDNPKVIEVIDNIFKEYLQGPNPVFIGDEVHIGTDEYAKEDAEKFRAFTDHYIKFVQGYGKWVRMWGSLTHAKGTTPVKSDSVTMNLWYNGYADPKEMMNLGYNSISTPDGWLYIVPKAGYYYDYLNLENIYKNWQPNIIGDQVFSENDSKIRGGSFAVWNDHVGNGITEKDVNDRAFPAMQVLSQKMWDGSQASKLISFENFTKEKINIGEGPGLNMRGKIKSKTSEVYNLQFANKKITDFGPNKRTGFKTNKIAFKTIEGKNATFFNGGDSYIETPITEIGYNYTISFDIYADGKQKSNAVLFNSPNAVVKVNQQETGKLGFTRENYNYNFNYSLPENKWTNITITGNNNGTSLYANGILIQKLEDSMHVFSEKVKMAKVQTLFFPLKYIGDKQNSFKGYLGNLLVFNRLLTEGEIKKKLSP